MNTPRTALATPVRPCSPRTARASTGPASKVSGSASSSRRLGARVRREVDPDALDLEQRQPTVGDRRGRRRRGHRARPRWCIGLAQRHGGHRAAGEDKACGEQAAPHHRAPLPPGLRPGVTDEVGLGQVVAGQLEVLAGVIRRPPEQREEGLVVAAHHPQRPTEQGGSSVLTVVLEVAGNDDGPLGRGERVQCRHDLGATAFVVGCVLVLVEATVLPPDAVLTGPRGRQVPTPPRRDGVAVHQGAHHGIRSFLLDPAPLPRERHEDVAQHPLRDPDVTTHEVGHPQERGLARLRERDELGLGLGQPVRPVHAPPPPRVRSA